MSDFSRLLLEWYTSSARSLPWRNDPQPYAVWVSEIMLQQTRVDTVLPYFLRWMERFPTIADLAAADVQEVLQVWEGLGYYSRARNLHEAARQVVAEFDGRLPAERDELDRLPGIGRYTAGAIASIAFGRDEIALDGNLRRVAARIFDIALPARSPQGEALLLENLQKNLPSGRAGDFNQAMMDLGSSICTPREPDCPHCPLLPVCQAAALGVQLERPVLDRRPASPHYLVTAAVIRRGKVVLITRRPAKGLLGGMWEFPGGKLEAGETLSGCLAREIREELGVEIHVGQEIGVFRHAYTHFKVTLHAFEAVLLSGEPQALHADDLKWATVEELSTFPMGKIDRQISKVLADSPEAGVKRHSD